MSDLQFLLFPSAYLLPLNDLRFSLCFDLLLLLSFRCLPGRGVRSGRILSLGSRIFFCILVLFIISEETSQWLHVIIALILSYGFVKLGVALLAVWLFVSKLGLIRGLNSRLFIGCEGTYWIVLLLTIQGDDAGLQRGTMRNWLQSKEVGHYCYTFFFGGVPTDSRVVVDSILSLLGIHCSGIIIACRDSMWIPFSITDFLLWTACLADVDAATRASRTYTLAAGTCRDRKAEGAWKGHDSLSIQHYTTISKISYISLIFVAKCDESFFLLQGQKNSNNNLEEAAMKKLNAARVSCRS